MISDNDSGLKVRVSTEKPAAGTAFGIGTLYIIKGGFIPVKVYLFQVVNDKMDAEGLKNWPFSFLPACSTPNYTS